MLSSTPRAERDVDTVSETALRNIYACAMTSGHRHIAVQSWTPRSVRIRRKRRFAVLIADGVPQLVAKASLDADDAKVSHEWAVLSSLALPQTVARPRALQAIDHGFVMTYAPSEDLPDALLRLDTVASRRAVVARTVDMLAAMHRHGRAANVSRHRGWEAAQQYVPHPFAELPRFRAALEHAEVGPTHGDVAPWNVRHDTASGCVSLIDWEDYRPVGVTAIDVINVLVTMGVVVFPEHREHGWAWLYDRMFASDHWYAALVRDEVVRYAAVTGQLPQRVIDLLPFFCQWLMARISSEGRDPAPLYYATFLERYVAGPPRWVPCD